MPLTSLSEPVTSLVVRAIHVEAEGVISLDLAAADGQPLPAWTPGAHIGLMLPNQMERHYSLCGDPADAACWRVAVLREPESRGGSAWLHSSLKPGDVLAAHGPTNQFALVEAKHTVFIAGGIGITPLLPMIRQVRQRGGSWRLLYGGRKLGSMAFLRELAPYGDAVQIQPEDTGGLLDLSAAIGAARPGTVIYSCGPERLLQAVEAACEGWPEGTLHIERFRAKPGALAGELHDFELVLAKAGRSCHVGAEESIIEALDRLGIHVPRSCGEGTCGTCLTPVVEGLPDHRDSFLMGKKRAANKSICVCCSRSLTPRLVLDL